MHHFLQKIIGDESRFDLSHRILNISLLFGIIISLIAIVTNYFLALPWVVSLITFASILVFSFAYFLSITTTKSKLPTLISFGFLVVFFSPVMWFVNGGSSGGFQYYIFFFLTVILVVTKEKISTVLIGILAIASLSSLVIEFYHPELIIQYPGKTERFLDVTISFIIAFVGIAIYVNTNLKQYISANEKLNLKNILLEKSKQEISEHKQKIEQQKNDIEEKAKSLQELNKTKDRFFSIISHDLKSPFNSLLGLTELLQFERKEMNDAEVDKLIGLINRSSEQAYKLVLNLLEWARSQTNEIEFKPKKLDLQILVDENIDLVKAHATNKGIKIHVEKKNKKTNVFADENMINTVLRNLISNAIKYTENGKINITINCGTEYCVLKISDTGMGLSKENMEKLFDINKGVSALGTGGEKGTGLGLVLCKEFIEKNKGEIFVESVINKGSVFSFSLPIFKDKI